MSSSQQPSSSAANLFSSNPTQRSFQCYNCNHHFFITRVPTDTASSSSSPPPPTSFRCPICFHLHLIPFHTVVPPPPPTSTPLPPLRINVISGSQREEFFQTCITRFLNSLPVKELDTNTISNESACSICMEQFGGKIVVELPCGHYFDKECIRGWIERRRNCPLCRSRLSLGDAYERVGRSLVVRRGMNEAESSSNAEARGARVLVLPTNFVGRERANAEEARAVVQRWVLSMNGGGESSRSTGTTTDDDDDGDTMSGDAA